MLLTNVIGTFAVTKAFLPLLKQGKKKVIVNMSSDAGCLTQNAPFIHDNQPSDAGMALSYRTSKVAVNMGEPTGGLFNRALLTQQSNCVLSSKQFAVLCTIIRSDQITTASKKLTRIK